jgi:nucleotide-binding universal stress UspA family protein
MYETILLPTDGSEASKAAYDHAMEIAERFDATLHVLYVADTTEYSTVTFEDNVVDSLEREGKQVVDGVVEDAEARDVDAVGVVMQGGAYETIQSYVDENDVDMVVMGTHGRSGFDRIVLGSVTEHVVRTADVPVVTARETSDEA